MTHDRILESPAEGTYASMPGGPVAFGDSAGGGRRRPGRYPAMPEEHVMRIWEEEAGSGRRFRLRDGRGCTVLHPGELNGADGPDYLGARLRIDEAEVSGDIELHLRPEQWRQHGHHRDPGYDGVVLHVCMYPPRRAPGGPPLLVLADQLLRPVRSRWADILSARAGASRHCAGLLSSVPAGVVDSMLMLAAGERFARKCRVMNERYSALSRQNLPGTERQLLFEYIARALGYGGNQDGLQRLAEALPLRRLAAVDGETRLASLQRAAGLPVPATGEYLRAPAVGVMKPGAWKQVSVTPANRIDPALRRVVAAASCLSHPRWWDSLREACHPAAAPDDAGILRLFRFLGQGTPARGAGEGRAREILVNAFAPWSMLCGSREGIGRADVLALHLYHETPSAASNHLTRSFELETGFSPALRSGLQQGMIELGAQYCDRGRCHACLIGTALKQQ